MLPFLNLKVKLSDKKVAFYNRGVYQWQTRHPVYFWPKLTRRLEEGSHQVAIFQIVMVVIATKRSQGDPGSAKSMHAKTDILTH